MYAVADTTLQRAAAILYGDKQLWPIVRDRYSHADNVVLPGSLIEPVAVLNADIVHVIESTDTYIRLSEKYYGCEHFYLKLMADNNNLILEQNIGQTLTVKKLL